MLMSELANQLQELIKTQGDIQIGVACGDEYGNAFIAEPLVILHEPSKVFAICRGDEIESLNKTSDELP